MTASGRVVLALDIGGTKFAAALVREDGSMSARAEIPVGPDPAATLDEVVRLVAVPGLAGVGIGSAGPLDAVAGTVSPVNIPLWRDFPLVEAVGELVPGVPVRLAGDAQCMALGEWWRGRPGREPYRNLLGIVVSTGVGGGLVIDGVPYLGPTGNAGHIGHITVDRGGEPCPCGGTGCVETFASGPSMVRWALARGWIPDGLAPDAQAAAGAPGAPGAQAAADAPDPADARDTLVAGAPDARLLARDAARGNPIARLAFQRAADALGTAILSAAALFDLDNVVIGGGVSAAGPTLLDPVRQAIAREAGLGFLRRLRVAPTTLARDAGLYGAAALALPP
ncbi:ROK family protein [Microtetraspora sp. AC03309]|uniref:ROK family protein n=1 Tax=Microtetraspora sp. AC03309 TaxID=2779376 RepID=UPI001E285765|nr:ROK family protein [Microtetraspora sp. AC03309]MCC5580747.1 ROK family protein [Microtetraspora sp. AC03309]